MGRKFEEIIKAQSVWKFSWDEVLGRVGVERAVGWSHEYAVSPRKATA